MPASSLGDLPYLLRQRFEALRHGYANSSLFTKNATFVVLGAVAGYFVGKAERQRRLAEGDLNRNVHVTFYTLPHTPSLSSSAPSSSSSSSPSSSPPSSSSPSSSSVGSEEKVQEWRQARKAFEQEWNRGARAVQRLPGYSWTQIYRLSPQQPQVFPFVSPGPRATERRGVLGDASAPRAAEERTKGRPSGGREEGAETEQRGREGTPHPPDYIQLRQWFGDASEREKERARDASDVAAMCVEAEKAEYEIVVDDSLVRIIQ
ncbi:hypothetical protein TGDOM2_267700 [Toxoplasma gondii GAB2-2007-GAL-DOM2]|uniref:Uncharacterized protein n=9 Tax=Toxoplasma gondii TaxID=5811 RepID=B9QP46_TOXGV|nr:hypothetical protein TGGT1_267700 [Toxoplasma gondii GT1]ESS33429.1 hypothetical protein TGVEG_267700 [Toxoplasma gondii VEG]KAF4644043.1 hypothetical protein TGRH88_010410 [Toxoplasma gondii]KFG29643.1 hypothetical protein TGP89_267700 [Toxoplasma gondii p89]KFG38919.1 hypothetical protein TGDOM2_267700 [Toxoplasma gondii GAB2-2007-GAL-DOM2]KFG42712.1 hypothetical protein TGFOU_267700 [Toxoplasma gondii FOU]KFH13674.1 hypothetical protein TGMAS_267700 [Toxoplasma gondii MAS]PUA85439.1 hy